MRAVGWRDCGDISGEVPVDDQVTFGSTLESTDPTRWARPERVVALTVILLDVDIVEVLPYGFAAATLRMQSAGKYD